MLTGDARYADLLERTLYNAVLPAVSLDGKRYFYTNPLRVDHDLPYTLRWSKEREEYISLCNCCPPNIVRTIAETGNYLYSISEEGIWFNLYGGNVLETALPDGSTLSLEQSTHYPWNGDIRIKLNKVPEEAYSLFLRIPEWADTAMLCINGTPLQKELKPGTYCELRQSWKAGDIIEMNIPVRAKLVQAHPLVEETSNQVAVQRGPIVYCLESVDIPEGIRISDLAIPADVQFNEISTSIDEARMLLLEADAHVVSRNSQDNNLYRELDPGPPSTAKIRLIPYYAWGNRGRSDMTVWMAVDY
jgi:DUF1680 family protein